MNKIYTLKELADIGAKRAHSCLDGYCMQCNANAGNYKLPEHENARIAFTKAILDAIGYQLPKDEEREAFEKWYECVPTFGEAKEVIFASWKAGREELRKAINKPSYAMPPSYAGITLLGTKPNEPEWIPWNGGECPLSDKVKRWEYKMRNGKCHLTGGSAQETAYWHHLNLAGDIIAYRVLE